ncbi:related to aminotriazole resistance protein [Fusarium oxysporum]|uniref:Related to aminotriazole resistance protein n=1 Tax=Fusarium oxysporum TaxID=5507 RepID=A0A2H3TZR8_FUSOX|nr:related to aminotriazole resistance protein [Fusarium oxysporum]
MAAKEVHPELPQAHSSAECHSTEDPSVPSLELGAVDAIPPTDMAASSPDKEGRYSIVFLIVFSNILQFISNNVTIGGGLGFSEALGHKVGPGDSNWMAASYSLTQGACVLITGRLGDIYGHQRLMLIGFSLFTLFSLVNVFCTTFESFIATRALTGVAGGIYMPNSVAVLTCMLPLGRSRNITLALYGSAPPIGGVVGAILAGVFLQFSEWKWLFIILVDKNGKIDYIGTILGLSGLLLFNVVWNQAPSVGWSTPYEIALLVVSVTLFSLFLFWERYVASEPVMPLRVFHARSFTGLVFVVLLTYMAFGISLWYAIAWQQILRGITVLQVGLNFIPFGIGSVTAVGLSAWMISRFAAEWIMALGVASVLVASILLAAMPVKQIYWAQTFPAMLLGGFCPDLVYVAAQIIASNSVSRRYQGVAGSLIGTLNLYGNSLGLGFAGTIEREISRSRENVAIGYRAALVFSAALALAALVLDFAVVRMPKDKREGWNDEDQNETLSPP